MAQPKRRHSKSRKNKRRSHDGLVEPTLAECTNCGAFHEYHRACKACGFYRGRQVLNVNN